VTNNYPRHTTVVIYHCELIIGHCWPYYGAHEERATADGLHRDVTVAASYSDITLARPWRQSGVYTIRAISLNMQTICYFAFTAINVTTWAMTRADWTSSGRRHAYGRFPSTTARHRRCTTTTSRLMNACLYRGTVLSRDPCIRI